jgi:hypothetical protein
VCALQSTSDGNSSNGSTAMGFVRIVPTSVQCMILTSHCAARGYKGTYGPPSETDRLDRGVFRERAGVAVLPFRCAVPITGTSGWSPIDNWLPAALEKLYAEGLDSRVNHGTGYCRLDGEEHT